MFLNKKTIIKPLLLIIFFLGIFLNINSQDSIKKLNADTNKQKDEITIADTSAIANEPTFVIVEENATFRGGDLNTFKIWVEQNLIFPIKAAKSTNQRKLIVQFAVNSQGNVVNALPLHKLNPDMEKEALRCINNSPKWKPARQDGRPVKQQFIVQIDFQTK